MEEGEIESGVIDDRESKGDMTEAEPMVRVKRFFFGSRSRKHKQQQQCLPMADPVYGRVLLQGEPQNAQEYLLMVAQEAARQPDVVVAFFHHEDPADDPIYHPSATDAESGIDALQEDEADEDEDDADDADEDDADILKQLGIFPGSSSQPFSMLDEDKDPLENNSALDTSSSSSEYGAAELLASFQEARSLLKVWKDEQAYRRVPVPHRNDRPQWHRLASSSSPAGPTSSLLLSMDDETVVTVLNYHVQGFEEELVLSKTRGLWLYGLLSVLPACLLKRQTLLSILFRLKDHCATLVDQEADPSSIRVILAALLHFI